MDKLRAIPTTAGNAGPTLTRPPLGECPVVIGTNATRRLCISMTKTVEGRALAVLGLGSRFTAGAPSCSSLIIPNLNA